MIGNDYITKLIDDMVRTVLKLKFNMEEQELDYTLVEDVNLQAYTKELFTMVDSGEINDAENKLYDLLDINDMETLKVALLFYSKISKIDDDTLDDYDFSKEEVKAGLRDVASMFSLDSLADTFLG